MSLCCLKTQHSFFSETQKRNVDILSHHSLSWCVFLYNESERNEAVILPNISICVPRKKGSHTGLKQHEGEQGLNLLSLKKKK